MKKSLVLVWLCSCISLVSAYGPIECGSSDPCNGIFQGGSTCMVWTRYINGTWQQSGYYDFPTTYFGSSRSMTFKIKHVNQQYQHCVCDIFIRCNDGDGCDENPCYLDEFTVDTTNFPNITVYFNPDWDNPRGYRTAVLEMYYKIQGTQYDDYWSANVCLTGRAIAPPLDPK